MGLATYEYFLGQVDGDPKKIAVSPDLIKPEFMEESERLRKEVMATLQCKTILSEDARGEKELTLDPESERKKCLLRLFT